LNVLRFFILKRRIFIRGLGFVALNASMYHLLLSCSKEKTTFTDEDLDQLGFNDLDLALSDELSQNTFDLNVTKNTVSIFDYTLEGYTINGIIPSPTIKVDTGETLTVNFINNIDAPSIIHWHGLIVPPLMDGHPSHAIQPNNNYPYEYKITQRAGTYFYHSHTHGITGRQVYLGMAGLFIVTDDEERALNLPAGDYEIPLIIQDKVTTTSKSIIYAPSQMDYRMLGYLGDTIFINGVPNSYKKVKKTTYRFRVLNGSNARIYKLAFDNNLSFTIIGTDGGLLENPKTVSSALISTGERLDILVDFSNVEDAEINLISDTSGLNLGGGGMNTTSQNAKISLLKFVVENDTSVSPYSIPSTLSSISYPNESQAQRTRNITLNMLLMAGHAINGKQYNSNQIEFEIPQGSIELWTYTNTSNTAHPMHIHGVQFKVVSRSQRGVQPWETGLKDTVLVLPNEVVTILVHFTAEPGLYLFHCHNLEHEDAGMMLNFSII
jgi:FtsP/CotA-like multicopper oxidase with cupredoxin domain